MNEANESELKEKLKKLIDERIGTRINPFIKAHFL